MRELILNIERVRRINETHQHVILSTDHMLLNMKAGQSLLARVTHTLDPYLREHWFPVSVNKSALVVERPITSMYMPSTQVSVLGIVGQPFRYRRTLRSVLMIALDTAPTPLLFSIPALLVNHVNVTLVLLGTAVNYKTEHLPPEVEILHGDEQMNWANRVTTIGWADQVFVVVNPADEMTYFTRVLELFRQLRADLPSNYLFGVFQPPLPCGVGACGACVIRTKGTSHFACEQGPAFDLTEVKFP